MTGRELFNKIDYHLLYDYRPAVFLAGISESDCFKTFPFSILYKQKQTMQHLKYHPEGSVWKHTLLVVNQAAKVKEKSSDKRAFMWAALLHDIGKPQTTREIHGRITSYNHEKVGEELAEKFLSEFGCDKEFINKVKSLVRWHMQVLFAVKNSSFSEIKEMIKQTNPNEIALLGYCDRMGRGNSNKNVEKQNMKIFLDKVNDLE